MENVLETYRDLYERGVCLAREMEERYPEFCAFLKQPLQEQFRLELLSWFLYLCESHGSLDMNRTQYIDFVLDYPYSEEQLSELLKRLQLHHSDFASLIPTLLKVAVKCDSLEHRRWYSDQTLRLLDRLGEGLAIAAGEPDALEAMDRQIYMLSLTNWVQKNISPAVLQTPEPSADPSLSKMRSTPASHQPRDQEQKQESLQELLDELNTLIGLEQVKEEVASLANVLKIRKLRKERNMKEIPVSLHLVFTGNPGTGKTTVARLIGKIYHALGALSQGQLIETDRSELVEGYIGQTATKTQQVIDKAMGGVLFIDEAYALTQSQDAKDFGYEAVNTLLLAMENHREDFALIVAGYPKPMRDFLHSNPGLESRFSRQIFFPDYSPQELADIFENMVNNGGYCLDEGGKSRVRKLMNALYENRDEHFANGRTVRNYFEKVITVQANRLAKQSEISNRDLELLLNVDLEQGMELLKQHMGGKVESGT